MIFNSTSLTNLVLHCPNRGQVKYREGGKKTVLEHLLEVADLICITEPYIFGSNPPKYSGNAS